MSGHKKVAQKDLRFEGGSVQTSAFSNFSKVK